MYTTVLYNDEVHTFDEVITTLQRAVDNCDRNQAIRFLRSSLMSAFIHLTNFFVTPAVCSASINGILQCGLGGRKLYIEEKETF